MKKYLLTILLGSCFASAFALGDDSISNNDSVSDSINDKIHDNKFTFSYDDNSGITSINFVYIDGEYEISPGQQLTGVSVTPSKGSLEVHVYAGRHGSSIVSDSWKKYLQYNDLYMLGLASGTTQPRDLNFWVGGTLYINGVALPNEFYLGQGSNGVNNNWWLGNVNSTLGNKNPGPEIVDANRHVYCIDKLGHGYDGVGIYSGYCGS